jgi:hypothetical protein
MSELKIPKQYDTLVGEAAAFAVRAHDGQVRMGTRFPYVVHPLGVGMLLRDFYPDHPELEAAGYLHDVVEDTDISIQTISEKFGVVVAYYVECVTRQPGVDLMQNLVDSNVARLKAADLIDNMLDTIRGIEKGHDVWERFSKGRGKINYWRNVTQRIIVTLKVDPILEKLVPTLNRVQELANEN